MKQPGMAIHSDSSFNESLEIRILSGVLESKKLIKTFFKENDKTPNYDGSFEILGKKNTPRKQFIVQIKKIENIQQCSKGKHKGKYIYDLETAFLYYVKEKVTESPAIYFVVDIITKRIFWLYLSDEILMKLDFEGKEKVRYAFIDTEILVDIDNFTNIVNKIADERNKKFINKTPKEIADIQESVEYINNLFNNGLSFIKESIFPDLWRFGIAHSKTNSLSVTVYSHSDKEIQTLTPPITDIFALYPQIKGELNYGFKEFYNDGNNYFRNFDSTGTATPKKYVTQVISRIVKDYFEFGLLYKADIFPDILIKEIAFKFIGEMNGLFNQYSIEDKVNVDDIYKLFFSVLNYLNYILSEANLTKNEMQYKSILIRYIQAGQLRYNLDFIRMAMFYCCKESFQKFYLKEQQPEINLSIFSLLQKKYILYFIAIEQLIKRKITQIEAPWQYNYHEIRKLNKSRFLDRVNTICDTWLTDLPHIYTNLYDKLFNTRKYFNNGRFEYALQYNTNGNLLDCIKKYEDDKFSIRKGNFVNINQWKREKEVLSISGGFRIEHIIRNNLLLYDSLRCLLYQGMCKGLGIDCEGVGLNKIKLFH